MPMDQKGKSIEQFIREQVAKWKTQTKSHIPVITISAEPGSGGRVIAQQAAERLKLDLYDRDMVKTIAESAKISDAVIESIEKERLSGVQDFISSLVDDRYLWPGVYLQHLMRVVAVIAKHGNAIIVGRGVNFIIPAEERLAVRVVAPLDLRVMRVAEEHGVTLEDARRRVIHRQNRRAAFIKQSFNADVADPVHYDLVINTGKLSMDAAVGAIIGCIVGSKEAAVNNLLNESA
jgi:cytidylate kinase